VTSPLFALTSDLGTESPAVAQLKAVLLAAVPEARIVDLSHAIPPQSLRYAELALRSSAYLFPPGTAHVVVVDPGVGTDRRAIAVRARDRFFVGPDNGVLGLAVAEPGAEVVSLDKPDLWRHPVANTFHGRDIFAPVAAHLAAGRPLSDAGTAIKDGKPSGIPLPRFDGDRTVVGEALGADRFGNLTTNIPIDLGSGRVLGESWSFEIDGALVPYRSTYMAAKEGRLIVTAGADRYLEVAVTVGSAAERLGRSAGIEIFCRQKR
jgi:S-adenosyl-L-methionine hydrolase (adenosine-forming)